MANTYDDAVLAAQEEDQLVDAVIAFIQSITTGENVPPSLKAKLDTIINLNTAGKKKLSDALTANTPVAPQPVA